MPWWSGPQKGSTLQVFRSDNKLKFNLEWSYLQSLLEGKAWKLGRLYWQFYGDSDTSTLKALYIKQVWPHLEYATPVWDVHLSNDIEAIESVQRFATKMFIKQWRNVNFQDRLKLMNLKILHTRCQHVKLCYLYKIVNVMGSPISSTHHSHISHLHIQHEVSQSHIEYPFHLLHELIQFLLLSHSKIVESIIYYCLTLGSAMEYNNIPMEAQCPLQ